MTVNPYEGVMKDAVATWRRALQPEGKLPEEVLTLRYLKQHRNNPAALGAFFQEAVKRGELAPEDVEGEMQRYVEMNEKILQKREAKLHDGTVGSGTGTEGAGKQAVW